MEKVMTKNQLRAIQAIMSHIVSDRTERIALLETIFNRPFTTTKELTFAEAQFLIDRLGGDELAAVSDRKKRLKAAIYHLSMRIDFLNAAYAGRDTPEDVEMNKANVDRWLLNKGIVKKKVSEMTLAELGRVISQMKSILHRQDYCKK